MQLSRAALGRLALLFCGALPAAAAEAPPLRNGFVLQPSSVPVSEILAAGPLRDGIPALSDPEVLPAARAPWHEDEWVIGVVVSGHARAYPIAILNWHELVNDRVGGLPILVSYCPLCRTALVFDRRVAGQVRTFGVSGLLYHSDLLLYDRETESLWSQIASTAVTGKALGKRLRIVRSTLLSWGEWRQAHPDTEVLSPETGYTRPYGRDPYEGYASSAELMFPAPLDPRYPPKTPTLGLRLAGGAARAYPASEIERAGGRVEERFEGRAVTVSFDREAGVFDVDAPLEFEVIEGYWFAWAAFHPGSSVFVMDPNGPIPPARRGPSR